MDEERQEDVCEECGRRRATVHLTDLTGDKPVLRHYCDRCYAKQEATGSLSPADLFAHILAAVAPGLRELSEKKCPECGISYLEFRQSGVLGCPADYQAFGESMAKLLEQVHGSRRHCGKVPPQAGRRAAIQSKLRVLRARQERAVSREDYELAAELRDRIKALEAETDGPGEPEG